jgi:hypothetical protein
MTNKTPALTAHFCGILLDGQQSFGGPGAATAKRNEPGTQRWDFVTFALGNYMLVDCNFGGLRCHKSTAQFMRFLQAVLGDGTSAVGYRNSTLCYC